MIASRAPRTVLLARPRRRSPVALRHGHGIGRKPAARRPTATRRSRTGYFSIYIYGPGGLPVEQIVGSTTTYLHHDQIGINTSHH